MTLRARLNSTSLNRASSTLAAHTSNHPVPSAPSLSKVKSYPIQVLDTLVTKHFRSTQSAPLCLAGSYLPLVYKLVATLISSPQNKAVVIIDIDAKFDITRVLQCAPHPPPPEMGQAVPAFASPAPATTHASVHQPPHALNVSSPGPQQHSVSISCEQRVFVEDLKHVHVYRPARGSPSYIRQVLTSAEHFIVYSRHASVGREWWGTIIIGGGNPATSGPGHADVTTGWKGWLRVDRDEVRGFPIGMSAEEALQDRDQRQRAADASGYTASSAWGTFSFQEAAGE